MKGNDSIKLNEWNNLEMINVNDNLYIYKCFFEEEKYIQLTLKSKYILTLLYALTDENNYFLMKQIDLARFLAIAKQNVNSTVVRLAKYGFINIDGQAIKVNRPSNQETIPLHKSLVFGKYKALSTGAKLLFSYFRWLQVQQRKDYLLIKASNISKNIGVSIKSLQTYYKELESVGLLERGKEGRMNTLNFKKISK